MKGILIILTLTSLFISGCDNQDCDDTKDYPSVFDGVIAFDFVDKSSNDYLIKESFSKYAKDDINAISGSNRKLRLNFTLNALPEKPLNRYYRVSISDLFDGSADIGEGGCKVIFIDFKSDRDTIKYCYKVKRTPCASLFGNLTVEYNGSLVSEITNEVYSISKVVK